MDRRFDTQDRGPADRLFGPSPANLSQWRRTQAGAATS